MGYVDWKDLIHATNNGLDIIRMVYPNIDDALNSRDKKFKARAGEKTASASLRLKDGHYHVTDFGGDQKEYNSIGVYMQETGKTFPEAVNFLAAHFNVKGSDQAWTEIKPVWETRPLKDDETPKSYSHVFKDFTKEELALLGPCVTAAHCKEFNFESLESFTYCKENEASVTSSTDTYPIYGFTHNGWMKIYQPLSFKKQYRFRFLGTKPERFIYGLDLVKKQFAKNKKRVEEDYDPEVDKKMEDPRLDHVFIVSGGSDGLNLRSFGYFPIWYNSEAEMLNFEEYRELQTYTKEIIYIPDLDSTGRKQASKIALTFLDIKIMTLPSYLQKKKDKRGNPCKDFKDFVVQYYNSRESKSFTNRLKKLVENALPAQFWDEIYTKNELKYVFRQTQFYNFLKLNGFGRIKDEHTKDGYHFVHVDGNIVRKVLPVEIETFVHQFLKSRQLPVKLRDLVYSKQLSQSQLNKLDSFNIEFSTSASDTQYMFFENAIIKIDANGLEKIKRGEVEKYIWETKKIEHNINLDKFPQFEIGKDVHGNADIKIHVEDNMFFNYLINTSRIHWRKETETNLAKLNASQKEAYLKANKFNISGPNLEAAEQLEQKLHLINKIFALGYMLHTYKSPDKPWAVYAMDNKLSDVNESHGGSGKSIFQKAIQKVLKNNHYIPGRDPKKTQDDFIYHGVTEECDYIFVDDCHMHLDYGFFFPAITGDLEVNNKNGLRFVINFDKVPKIAFSSNYPPNNLDLSLARRLLYVVFSDYYHNNKDGEYNEVREPKHDFEGATLFNSWTENQWNQFYNFCAQCIRFYLSQTAKIDPPMDNVIMRNLLSEMGDNFKDWADVYFAQKDENDKFKYLNTFVVKDDAFEDLKNKTGFKYSPNKFKKNLKAYAKFNEWEFNPTSSGVDASGRIIHRIDGNTKEVFFMKTPPAKQTEVIAKSKLSENKGANDDLDNDLPF
ncbi:hypothetical protein JJL45_05345 [Tamlana sp. s12]|uniref:hypothetical protein n=1 Tax=Tamlana sp. s12 TaxID=1630406 RepID=UPI0007FED9CC|nr:hypothetical protein [Tamlana sp. s12]OBQ56070.1 hypothetical protein VQ01_06715 [Tamlana sp. s12]QQY83417.1 hypothetical protein JJL45_05345 [Tamlana sp. s12]